MEQKLWCQVSFWVKNVINCVLFHSVHSIQVSSEMLKVIDFPQMTDLNPVVQAAQVTVVVSNVTHKLQMASVVPQPPQLDPQGYLPAFWFLISHPAGHISFSIYEWVWLSLALVLMEYNCVLEQLSCVCSAEWGAKWNAACLFPA